MGVALITFVFCAVLPRVGWCAREVLSDDLAVRGRHRVGANRGLTLSSVSSSRSLAASDLEESAAELVRRQFCASGPLPFLGLRLCIRLDTSHVGLTSDFPLKAEGVVQGMSAISAASLALVPDLWVHVELAGCDRAIGGCIEPPSYRRELFGISAKSLVVVRCASFAAIPAVAAVAGMALGPLGAVGSLLGGPLTDRLLGTYCIYNTDFVNSTTGEQFSCIDHFWRLGLSRKLLHFMAGIARRSEEEPSEGESQRSVAAFLETLASTPDNPGEHIACVRGGDLAAVEPGSLAAGAAVPAEGEDGNAGELLAKNPACSAFLLPSRHCFVCRAVMRSFLWRLQRLECNNLAAGDLLAQASSKLELTPVDDGNEYRLCSKRGTEEYDCRENLVGLMAVVAKHSPSSASWTDTVGMLATGASEEEAHRDEALKFLRALMTEVADGRLLHEVALDRLAELREALRPCDIAASDRTEEMLTQLCSEMSCGCPKLQALDINGQCRVPREASKPEAPEPCREYTKAEKH